MHNKKSKRLSMTWFRVLTNRTSEMSLNRSHISLHRVESYLASLAVKLFHYSLCDATLLKLALCHFLAVSARLKLGFWATYKQPLLLRCVCLLVCLFACLFFTLRSRRKWHCRAVRLQHGDETARARPLSTKLGTSCP